MFSFPFVTSAQQKGMVIIMKHTKRLLTLLLSVLMLTYSVGCDLSLPEDNGSSQIDVFSTAKLTTTGYEKYSNLDSLGRCDVAITSCGTKTQVVAI